LLPLILDEIRIVENINERYKSPVEGLALLVSSEVLVVLSPGRFLNPLHHPFKALFVARRSFLHTKYGKRVQDQVAIIKYVKTVSRQCNYFKSVELASMNRT